LATTKRSGAGDASAGESAQKTTRKPARKSATRKKATRSASPRRSTVTTEALEALEARVTELLTGVSSRLTAIEERLQGLRAAGAPGGPPAGAVDLEAVAGRLSEALAEVPRAADFEPLAEHIYELARHAPRLLEALEAVPAAMAPFEQSVASLRETAETFQYVHQSFSDSLLRLPRAEDYEPLARPLAEFARVSPALAESLADVLRVTAPLSGAVAGLRRVTEELCETREALGKAAGPVAGPDTEAIAAIESAAAEVQNARAAVDAALGSLPADPEYKKVAQQLREIASVSPSLMDWMQQVTPLSQPLGESVSALREASERLESGHARLREALARFRN
jgi:DNA repair ATPase RecN